MNILVINTGSSSLKSSIIDHLTGRATVAARVERIGEAEPRWRLGDGDFVPCEAANHGDALQFVLAAMLELPTKETIREDIERVLSGDFDVEDRMQVSVRVEGDSRLVGVPTRRYPVHTRQRRDPRLTRAHLPQHQAAPGQQRDDQQCQDVHPGMCIRSRPAS